MKIGGFAPNGRTLTVAEARDMILVCLKGISEVGGATVAGLSAKDAKRLTRTLAKASDALVAPWGQCLAAVAAAEISAGKVTP